MKIKTPLELDILNYYCPNDRPLSLSTIQTEDSRFIAVSDFNSHSQSWGYDHLDRRREEVENWQHDNQLLLVNTPRDIHTFYSRRWHTSSTPDLAFCTDDLHGSTGREVGEELGGSDRRPVFLAIKREAVRADPVYARWNYKKAKWSLFRHTPPVY